eukprot:symbB.v1.2.009880.t1/scaffold639.1/size181572/1
MAGLKQAPRANVKFWSSFTIVNEWLGLLNGSVIRTCGFAPFNCSVEIMQFLRILVAIFVGSFVSTFLQGCGEKEESLSVSDATTTEGNTTMTVTMTTT